MKAIRFVVCMVVLAAVMGYLAPGPLLPTVAGARSGTLWLGPLPPHPRLVTSMADGGSGTLREALQDAGAGDTILFAPAVFPPGQPATIYLQSRLATIGAKQAQITIDASAAGVILDGSAIAGDMVPGLDIQTEGVTVRGLQISGFSGNAIEIRTHDTVIGGDPALGSGPIGQGNLLVDNGESGVGLWGAESYANTIAGNLIGVDADGISGRGNGRDGIHINGARSTTVENNVIGDNGGNGVYLCCSTATSQNLLRRNFIGVARNGTTPMPNQQHGVWLDQGASANSIGPANAIAYNVRYGVAIGKTATQQNTITANSIYGNQTGGIDLFEGGNTELAAPQLLEHDLVAGLVSGFACAGCRVEVFSDEDSQGGLYEGDTLADLDGLFAFSKSSGFAGPHLTATMTDANGNTSEFSAPTSGPGWTVVLQTGNMRPKLPIRPLPSSQLADNRISLIFTGTYNFAEPADLVRSEIGDLGVKVVRASINEGDAGYIDWTKPEMTVAPADEPFYTAVPQQGASLMYLLTFWDKAFHQGGGTVTGSRLRTPEEVNRYLAYVDFIVAHFKDRVDAYELWNEPTNETPQQYVVIEDYLQVLSQAAPRIRAGDPGAKIAVGSFSGMDAPELRKWLFRLLEDDEAMAAADIVSWHPFFGAAPDSPQYGKYYAEYPNLVRQIQQTARAHGFTGQFRADEMVWRSPDCWWCAASDPLYSNRVAAKYYARGIVMHLGMDVGPGLAGMGSSREAARVLRNLATMMAGVEVTAFPIAVSTTVTNVLSYTLAAPNGDKLVAMWNHGVAVDDDPGAELSVRVSGAAGDAAFAEDALFGMRQRLVTTTAGSDLVIEDLLLRDYPLVVRLEPRYVLYLPRLGLPAQ